MASTPRRPPAGCAGPGPSSRLCRLRPDALGRHHDHRGTGRPSRSPGSGPAIPRPYRTATRRSTGLPDHGHVSARFGGIPVLVTAEMAAQIKAFKGRGNRDDHPVADGGHAWADASRLRRVPAMLEQADCAGACFLRRRGRLRYAAVRDGPADVGPLRGRGRVRFPRSVAEAVLAEGKRPACPGAQAGPPRVGRERRLGGRVASGQASWASQRSDQLRRDREDRPRTRDGRPRGDRRSAVAMAGRRVGR